MMPVINQLWPAGPADTRMHDRPARPTAFCWNQKYPRICGEKAAAESAKRAEQGSPPHMRGKARPAAQGRLAGGITPACAGKRRRPAFLLGGTQDHPRICGEKMNASVKAIELRGSPPHMRGKGQLGQRLECGPGITPAYAGKRKACAKNAEMSWDHPRICGEKLSFLGGLTDGPESPPPRICGGGVIPGHP